MLISSVLTKKKSIHYLMLILKNYCGSFRNRKMGKTNSVQLVKEIIKNIKFTIDELRQKGLIRDEGGVSEKKTGADSSCG